jgi:hypothetical protein
MTNRHPAGSNPAVTAASAKAGWRIKEFRDAVGCCNGTVHSLMNSGEIEFCKVGSMTIILTDPREFLRRKAAEQKAARNGGAVAKSATPRSPGRPRVGTRAYTPPPPAARVAAPAEQS